MNLSEDGHVDLRDTNVDESLLKNASEDGFFSKEGGFPDEADVTTHRVVVRGSLLDLVSEHELSKDELDRLFS